MHLDHDRCAAAVRSKDPRFDGWFYTGVRTTGIYCRPSCPAMTPKVENMTFYPSAAAAQGAGLRACKRCRPDASPGAPEWHVRGDLAARAVRLVEDGVVDREGVPGLAARLGYSTRQLERLLTVEVGAGPLALARAQRARTARTLLESTDLPLSDVAFAAGFRSVRSFNETVRRAYDATPGQLRAAAVRAPAGSGGGAPTTLTLRLPFRAPLHAPSLFGHLAATLAPGVEAARPDGMERTLRLPSGAGMVRLSIPDEGASWLRADLRLQDGRDLAAAVARCRAWLDLDADPQAVDAHLGLDPALAPLAERTPGVRLPRAVDAAELALRVVLGQQVSTAAARTLVGRLIIALGEPLPAELHAGVGDGGSTPPADAGPPLLFPTPGAVAAAPDEALPGMPASRRRTVRALAEALADGLDLGPGTSWADAREALSAIPGIGPWTVELVALRGLGDPDALPVTDLGVKVAAAAAGLPTGRELERRAEAWRPWRSYATQLLWASTDHEVSRHPDKELR